MAHYFKAVRPNGTDFWSGTIDYAAALATGEPIHHPDPRPGSRDATHYLSVATEVTECTGMRWPCRVYVVEPDGETWAPSSGLPHKVACTSVRVVEEVAATLALGPQAGEITALIERCTRITVTDMEKLAAARAAARAAAWDAARAAAWDAAWDAAWAARVAASAAARDAQAARLREVCAEIDAEITFKLFEHQQEVFKIWGDETLGEKLISPLVDNEMKLTNVCYDIERRGFKIDRAYCEKVVSQLNFKLHNLNNEFFDLVGVPFVDSPKSLEISLKKVGILGGKTELGNASFTDDVLSKETHRAARVILEIRDANKKLSSYFNAFLYYADKNDYIHCNIKQSATATGRFSITEPALQTLSADESNEESVRRAFIPEEDFCLVSIDYKAFEFRAMLDLAGEEELALKIEQGLDPHQSTADMVGISRKEAKTLNFMLLYGGGQQKLADSLGVPLEEAARIKRKYFRALPRVRNLIYNSFSMARERGFLWSIFNRRYFFHDSNFCYKALNYLIQGSTSDAMKLSMVRIDSFLKDKKSRMVLTVHDEIILYVYKDELDLIPEIMEIMRNAYPSYFHKMDCSVEHSWKSWGDLVEGFPVRKEL